LVKQMAIYAEYWNCGPQIGSWTGNVKTKACHYSL
jgi:hypothetical protein